MVGKGISGAQGEERGDSAVDGELPLEGETVTLKGVDFDAG